MTRRSWARVFALALVADVGCATVIGADFDVALDEDDGVGAAGSSGTTGGADGGGSAGSGGASGGSGGVAQGGASVSSSASASASSAASGGGGQGPACEPPCPAAETCELVQNEPRCTCGSIVGAPGAAACTGAYPSCDPLTVNGTCNCAPNADLVLDSCNTYGDGFICGQNGPVFICACNGATSCSSTGMGTCDVGSCACGANTCPTGAKCGVGDTCVCIEPGWVGVDGYCAPP